MSIEIKVTGRQSTIDSIREKMNDIMSRGVETKKSVLLDDLRNATPVDTGEARNGWRKTRDGLENSVDHISPLNEGTSQQAPAYFIEKTLLTHRDVLPSGIIVRHK